MRLKDRVAVITGASSGLGLGIAHAYAREGAKVVINGRKQEAIDAAVDAVSGHGGDVLGVSADVSAPAEVSAMFEQVLRRFGTVDILVNNAAYLNRGADAIKARADFMELMTQPVPKHSLGVTRTMSDEKWRSTMSASLDGVFYCTREALKVMEEQRSGKIVNIASTAGLSGLSAHNSAYSAAKGAVIAFTRAVAIEVIGAGINVNCLAPGGIASTGLETKSSASPQMAQRFFQFIPQGRFGRIDEYTPLAVFLASDDASYMVGQVVSPNGGLVT